MSPLAHERINARGVPPGRRTVRHLPAAKVSGGPIRTAVQATLSAVSVNGFAAARMPQHTRIGVAILPNWRIRHDCQSRGPHRVSAGTRVECFNDHQLDSSTFGDLSGEGDAGRIESVKARHDLHVGSDGDGSGNVLANFFVSELVG